MENLGPAPVPSPSAPAGISPQRAAVFDRLRDRRAPATVAELAAAAGQHENTVREHLDALVDLGLVTRGRAPARGRGRPAWRYAAAPDQPLPPAVREYVGLAGALAAQLARASGDPRGEALAAGEEWGRSLAGDAGGESSSGHGGGGDDGGGDRGAGHRVVALLAEIGFAPQVVGAAPHAAGHAPRAAGCEVPVGRVLLRRCPFLDVARRYPDVICTVHLGVVRGVVRALGGAPDRVTLHPFAEPGACRLDLDQR